jgi:DNA-binding MarR family transcriptional regulator
MSPELKFFLNLTMVQSLIAKRFDVRLSLHSIGLSDFMLLYHLDNAPEQKLRRVDLAEKLGLSASGVTRKLLPLEKIGMVKREADERDARVSFVKLAKGGKRTLDDALNSAEMAASELYPQENEDELEDITNVLINLGGTIK